MDMTRRNFVTAASAATVAAMGTSVALAETAPAEGEQAASDTLEADIVIAGAGAAGMFAAVEACRAGKSVIVVEKGSSIGMANGALAGGPFVVQSTAQKEAGIDICYAPWPRGTTTAARTVYLLEGIPFATSARGDNLNPADPDLVDKLNDALFIRTNNAADARRITGLAPACADRLRLVYNSLSLEVDSTAQVPMQPPVRLLAVGRFDITKGFDILLKACGILKERGRSFRLTLAGGGGTALGLGHMTQTILDLRKQLGLEKLVDLPGIVSHDQLPDLIRSHDIFLAPCVIHESGRRDGIPNTVIEAMSFGLPVIATNINALPEIVRDGETGLLIPQKDPVALAGAICRLMDNPEEARALGRRGAAFAADMFSPEKNGDRLAALFTESFHRRNPECAE